MIQYSQNDPAWKKSQLGFDRTSTIGNYGCLLTSMAMVATYYGADINPQQLNDAMKKIGGFAPKTAFVIAWMIGGAVPGFNLSLNYVKGAPMDDIDASLAQGRPVIIEIDSSPAKGIQTHYMVVYARKDGDYLAVDPWPYPSAGIGLCNSTYARIALTRKPANIIQAVFFTRGTLASPVAPPVGDIATYVTTSVDSLRLRSKPNGTADAIVLKFLPIGAKLKCIEPIEAAKRKAGIVNEWLNVIDTDGTQGYVAAWYVTVN